MPNTKLLGPPTRSLERVLSRTDVTPTRLLRVMWPVQRVEVEAESVEYQSFDLIDRFVLRAVAECELSRKSDIAAFLGVSEALIAGACAFLTQIQHLTQIGDLITITVFGRRSLASGSREVPQKSRLYLLFDGVTAQPLPRDYHRGDLTYDPEPSNREWERIPAYAPFPLDHVDRLFRRTDRSDFNLPTHLQALRVLTIKTVYTAVHLVQTHEHEILAFSEAMPDGDKIIGAILRQDDRIPGLIRSTPSKEPDEIWQKWRQGRPFGPLVRQRPDGVWRATYPARAFREHEIAPSRVGSFDYRDQHFIQLWCDSDRVRQQALVTRLHQMARTIQQKEDLRLRIRDLATVLELGDVSDDDVLGWATVAGLGEEIATLVKIP